MKLSKSKKANVNYLAKIVEIKNFRQHSNPDLSVAPSMDLTLLLVLIPSQDCMFISQLLVALILIF